MSVQFGRWNLDGEPVDSGYLEKVAAALAPYGPDGASSYNDKNVSILYHAFHTTKESRSEVQPHISASGAVITLDGRLDNRADLASTLRDSLTLNATDTAIVAGAYDKWGTNCFSKLIGDWALSIWNPDSQSVILAKDPIGTRHLYYSFDDEQISWCSVLDPLIQLAGKTFQLNEEYVAGWLAMFPAVQLTPWVGVHAVPPSTFVFLQHRKHAVRKYWDFDPNGQVRYRTDAEYEGHFRTVFGAAVQRRLRSDCPVLAELSGGRDSSSIVCIADEIIARGDGDTPRLDTISYYDDSEPNWNERPYFTKVEEKRGRIGWHVNVGEQDLHDLFQPHSEAPRSAFTPTLCGAFRTSPAVGRCMESQGNRVVLSGIGGDEVMGGVPTPIPELEDLLARAQFRALAHQLKHWALEGRRPWIHLFWETIRRFFPLVGIPKNIRPVPWIRAGFVKRHRVALAGYPSTIKLFGGLPSFQENAITLDTLRRQLACTALPFGPSFEKRYPYLDRDLLEFMFAIPREQLVRPTQRRSLMRRALLGIVPREILNRKSKGFVARSPMLAISSHWSYFAEMRQNMLCGSLGFVDVEGLWEVLQNVRHGGEIPMVTLRRTLLLERWFKDLYSLGIINPDTPLKPEVRHVCVQP